MSYTLEEHYFSSTLVIQSTKNKEEDYGNVYGDKLLREKVNRIIVKQKEGNILVAAYMNGTGLPFVSMWGWSSSGRQALTNKR
jgi:hypothetical protein